MNDTRMFADQIAAGIAQYLPDDGQVECKVVETTKNNNVSRVGLSFCREGTNISPVIYVEPYREAAADGRPMSEIMKEIAETISGSMERTPLLTAMDFGNYEAVKEYLSVTLVNREDNRQMLSQMPNRQIEDLALILEMKFPMQAGMGSVKVDHALAERWGVDPDTLFSQAEKNAMEKEPPCLQRLEETMLSMALDSGAPVNLLKADYPAPEEMPSQLYVLSNASKEKGAAVLSYPGVMEKTDRLFPEGFYILPSSVHELLIVPKSPEMEPKELGEMVGAINQSEVAKEDQLSDRVYTYDREAGKVRQVPESVKKKDTREAAR